LWEVAGCLAGRGRRRAGVGGGETGAGKRVLHQILRVAATPITGVGML
jgi:hypothetical protein